MKTRNFGGNVVKQLELGSAGKDMLGSGLYEYYTYETQENELLTLQDLRSCTVYVFHKTESAVISVQGINAKLQLGDSVQAEDCPVHLNVFGGIVKLLIAGTRLSHPQVRGLFLTKAADIYTVNKPWGYEQWINEQHPYYALKKIYIKAGTKTSLQYHRFKQETNVLFKGIAKLHYKKNAFIENDMVTVHDIGAVQVEAISIVDVEPLILHRLEAVTDIILFETSTPHLDDVVRVQDDSMRTHGRLASEHVAL